MKFENDPNVLEKSFLEDLDIRYSKSLEGRIHYLGEKLLYLHDYYRIKLRKIWDLERVVRSVYEILYEQKFEIDKLSKECIKSGLKFRDIYDTKSIIKKQEILENALNLLNDINIILNYKIEDIPENPLTQNISEVESGFDFMYAKKKRGK